MTQIRDAGPGDEATLYRFIVELAVYEREPDAVEVDVATLATQLAADPPPFRCVLAEANGETVGFALFFFNYSTWRGRRGLYLEDLFVAPAHRGAGHGVALLAHLARIAVDEGCARMEWAVLDWNTPAIDFYRRVGAVPMDTWTTFRLTGDALGRLAETAT